MPFSSQKPALALSEADLAHLQQVSRSRTEKHATVRRARMLLGFHNGQSISAIAREMKTSRGTVDRCVRKALHQGVKTALSDLPRAGRPRQISDEAIAWVVDLACTRPKEHGYASELWTYRALSKHIRDWALQAGYPELERMDKGLLHLLLSRHEVQPHKIRYYLERRDPEFEQKKAEILVVYKQVQMINEDPARGPHSEKMTTICVDEKPGIQALASRTPDRPPVPGQQRTWARDPEYVRLGTLSLLSGIDLHSGQLIGIVRRRHRSREFIELLQLLDAHYPKDWKIRLVVDNHSSHLSKETAAYLSTVANRFEFVFTPKHGSWLNLIEVFFSKMTRAFLRGIRVESLEELRQRIELYLQEVNAEPVVFRWKYQPSDV